MSKYHYIITREHEVYDPDKDFNKYPHQGWTHVAEDEIPLVFSTLARARAQLTSLVGGAMIEDGGFSDKEIYSNHEGTRIDICTSANIWTFKITEVVMDMTADELNRESVVVRTGRPNVTIESRAKRLIKRDGINADEGVIF